MPASPRHRRAVTATKHEPGLSPLYRVDSHGSALEVWALLMRSLSTPACTEQTTCRGAAFVSRLDPLAFRCDKLGRSKAPFFAVLNGGIYHRSRTGHDLATQRSGRSDERPQGQPQKPPPPPASDSSLALHLYHCSSGFLHAARTTFANQSRRFILCCGPASVLCGDVHKMLRCRLACISPPSSPDPKLAPESFAHAKG